MCKRPAFQKEKKNLPFFFFFLFFPQNSIGYPEGKKWKFLNKISHRSLCWAMPLKQGVPKVSSPWLNLDSPIPQASSPYTRSQGSWK
jgi:hypothetical protein